MLMVVTILSIVGAIAIPKLDYTGLRVDGAARVMRGTLMDAQRLAVQRQHDMIVSFDTIRGRIRIVYDLNNNHQRDADDRASWRPLEEGATFAVPPVALDGGATEMLTATASRDVDGMPSVIFHRDGAASTDLIVYLGARGAHAEHTSHIRAVTLLQSTGRTTTRKLGNGGWLKEGL
jgi:hypothetical protein